jgi:hypothetical protein
MRQVLLQNKDSNIWLHCLAPGIRKMTANVQLRGEHAVTVSMTLSALALLFVLIRLLGRVFVVKRVGLDDGLILAAVCFSFGLSGTLEIRE